MAKQRLTPIRLVGYKNWRAIWLFKCECGNEIELKMNAYKTGNTKSCGCHITNPEINRNSRDDTGKKYNRLTLLRRFKKRDNKKVSQVYYECLCDCGNLTEVKGVLLRNNNTKSCGCIDKENILKRNKSPDFVSRRNYARNKKYKFIHWKTKEEVYATGGWEASVLLYLNTEKIDFKWQIPFNLTDSVYVCDLYLIDSDMYVEIKGQWFPHSIKKKEEFNHLYPNLNYEVWDREKLYSMGLVNSSGSIRISRMKLINKFLVNKERT